MSQLQGALLGAPLPLSQSVLLIWPQLAGLVAAMVLVFTVAYVAFQRRARSGPDRRPRLPKWAASSKLRSGVARTAPDALGLLWSVACCAAIAVAGRRQAVFVA